MSVYHTLIPFTLRGVEIDLSRSTLTPASDGSWCVKLHIFPLDLASILSESSVLGLPYADEKTGPMLAMQAFAPRAPRPADSFARYQDEREERGFGTFPSFPDRSRPVKHVPAADAYDRLLFMLQHQETYGRAFLQRFWRAIGEYILLEALPHPVIEIALTKEEAHAIRCAILKHHQEHAV